MKQILIIAILCLSFVFKAQPPTRFYTKFGGPGVDIGYGVKVTLDRQYIVVGSTSSYGAGNTDVYLVKVDSMGMPLWQKTFGGFGNDVGRSVIQLPDSSYVLAGFTNSFGSGGYDAYIVRTDKNGTLVWQKTFGGLDWDFAYDLVYSSDGNIVVCGTTSSYGHGNMDGFVCKFDLSGTLVWQKFYGGVEDDELNAIINTNDNLFATVGYNKSFGDLNGNCYFLKLDQNGDSLFTRNFGGPGTDYLMDLIQKPYNEYIVVGAKTYSNNSNTQSAMFNLNSSGGTNWEGNFTYNTGDEKWVAVSNSFAMQDQTAYLKTSNPNVSFKLQSTIFVTKNGSIAPYIANSSGGTEDEIMYGMDKTKDGGYVSIGTTNSFGAASGDVYFIKQDSTIINYSSIVGIKKQHAEIIPRAYVYDNFLYLITDIDDLKEISVYDVSGRLQFAITVNERNLKHDISALPVGVFLVCVTRKDGKSYYSKFVKT